MFIKVNLVTMRRTFKQKIRWLFVALVFTVMASCNSDNKTETSSTESTPAQADSAETDKEAKKIMRQMSDYLTGLQEFSYKSEGMYEIIDTSDNKTNETYKAEVFVKRPNKLRANITGEARNGSFYYNGSQFAVMGKNVNMYAQTSAPPTLDQALDSAKYKLQLDPPGADLLYSDLYEGLMEETLSGKLVGEESINGTPCHHLAFKGKEVDWEIWIENGTKPLPRKYLIISKDLPQKPVFSVEFSDWETDPKPAFDDQLFVLDPPKGAQKITFLKAEDIRKAKNLKK